MSLHLFRRFRTRGRQLRSYHRTERCTTGVRYTLQREPLADYSRDLVVHSHTVVGTVLSEGFATRRLPQLLRAALRHCRNWLNFLCNSQCERGAFLECQNPVKTRIRFCDKRFAIIMGGCGAPIATVKCDVCGGIFSQSYLPSHKRLAHRKNSPSATEKETIEKIVFFYESLSIKARRRVVSHLTANDKEVQRIRKSNKRDYKR